METSRIQKYTLYTGDCQEKNRPAQIFTFELGLVDAFALGYAFDKHWNIQGTVTNLFDKEYVQSSDFGFAYLGERRVARATLTYNW